MKGSGLADILEDVASQLIADVEKIMSPTEVAVPVRDTIERLPGLMTDLIERLRVGRLDEPEKRMDQPIQFNVAPLVTALRLLKQAIYALIDQRQVPVTPREVRITGDWFAAVAESALAAENRRFTNMLDAIPDHLMLHNPEGFLIYTNRPAAGGASWAAGAAAEPALGRSMTDFVRDKTVGRMVDENIKRVLAGELITEEFVLPGPDGGRWNEHHVLPLYGPDGKIEAVATASRDIHARKKAEARLTLMSKLGALAETMEYESVLAAVGNMSLPELADCCLINVVENGHFRRASIAYRDPMKAAVVEELLRRPSQLDRLRVGAAALAGKSTLISELAQEREHADLAQSELVERLDVHSFMIIPFVVMSAPVAVASFMMTPESGRHYGAEDLALAQEMIRRAAQIVENAWLHQQLRQSEARFRVALERANISVFETDRELRMRWIYNARLGVPESELIGKTEREILGGSVVVDLDAVKRRVVQTGEGADTAYSRIVAGKKRHLMVRYEPLRGGAGIEGLTGATIDVTDLKEAEEQVARELAFRERMMGVLGHDLRNPVSAVLALAGLVRLDDKLSDKARDQLVMIEQSARRMNEMIGTLLDFTRLRFDGSLPVAVEEVDLDDLVRGVVAELQAAHRQREIELHASGNLRGLWDPGRIAQLLSNLASNALWHGGRESPVRVVLAGESAEVLLSVSNRGPGIPAELVERLFEPFQQGTNSASRRRQGLGLGLFIVREIVRAHGGTIDVCSRDDLTTFAVKLPRTVPPS